MTGIYQDRYRGHECVGGPEKTQAEDDARVREARDVRQGATLTAGIAAAREGRPSSAPRAEADGAPRAMKPLDVGRAHATHNEDEHRSLHGGPDKIRARPWLENR